MTFDAKDGTAVKSLAAKLAGAYRSGTPVALAELDSEALVPATIEAGAIAQAATVELIGREIAGWKVAINSDGIPVAAPILDLQVMDGNHRADISRPGVKALELEICFRLSDDIPAPRSGHILTREALFSKIASIHFGAELVGFRIAEGNKVPFPLFLADRLGSHSFVLGPQIDRAVFDLIAAQDESLPSLSIQDRGAILFTGNPKHPLGDPIGPLLAYANSPIDKLGGMKRGQIVTTGTLCGLVRLATDADIVIRGMNLPAMRLTISPT